MRKSTVIGAGVIGLTSAICLQEAGFQVSILTKDMPQASTSMAAGAVWWGYGEGRIRQWAKLSLKVYQDLTKREDTGVKHLRLRDVYQHKIDLPWFHADILHCERISQADLDAPYQDGFVIDVPLIEPPRYLPYLLKRYQANGGEIIQQEINSLAELANEHRLIVNCTGLGAGKVANDADVYPIRGQTVIVDAPEIQQGFMDDHHFTYIFPRSDGVLLGGILQANQTDLDVDLAVREDILARCTVIDERLKDSRIVSETVGLRPGRFAVRLETEQLSEDCLVIHNYGHAGIGFTLSWGCADEVVRLAQE